MARTETTTGWGGKLIAVLENISTKDQILPPSPERVITIPGLDKLRRAIMELQSKLVVLDSEEHALLLGFQEVEQVVASTQASLTGKRAEILEQMRQHQTVLVEAMKDCGIRAEIVAKGVGDVSGQ